MVHIRRFCTRSVIFFSCCYLFFFYACSHIQRPALADSENRYFESLQKRLIRDKFDKNTIRKLYADPRVKFNTKGISSYFRHKESTLNYDQFTERSAIERAFGYMKAHTTELVNAEAAYSVDRRIITAIILVETGFGTYLGKQSVLNTLSTMAALSDSTVKEMLWKKVSAISKLTREEFEKKADEKSEWAYKELKAFLSYTAQEKINPIGIKGSYAGAMGICQFMPSNILSLAKDGNNDGRIDLFNHSDAIMSIASYLSHYGWYSGIDRNTAFNVIYQYNHSPYYVNTILKIATLLKG